MQVQIKVVGMVQALDKVKALGAAAEQVNGPLATFANLTPYAYGIETGRRRDGRRARAAGGAFFMRKGVQDAYKAAPGIIGPAIPKGPAAVGQAKRKLRDYGIERIKAYTPVRSGNLRDNTRVLERPA